MATHKSWCPGGETARFTCVCGATRVQICCACGHVMSVYSTRPGVSCPHRPPLEQPVSARERA